nr:MAG TPA: hypothetical protein [Caudoviricetes sp.]
MLSCRLLYAMTARRWASVAMGSPPDIVIQSKDSTGGRKNQ